MDSLDDIDPLMEVVERYDFNKPPFLHMCDEAILSQLDSSNYHTLLPKYVSVMSEHMQIINTYIAYIANLICIKVTSHNCLHVCTLLYSL